MQRSCLFVRRQTYANQLFVIASKDMLVGKPRMRPADAAALGKLIDRWFEQMCATYFFVALRRQLGDNQITALVEKKVAIAVFHEVDGAPASCRDRGFVLP